MKAAHDADVLVVLTEWNEFRALDLGALRSAMRGNALVDLRNVYQREHAQKAGFRYSGIGLGGMANSVNGDAQSAEQAPQASVVHEAAE